MDQWRIHDQTVRPHSSLCCFRLALETITQLDQNLLTLEPDHLLGACYLFSV